MAFGINVVTQQPAALTSNLESQGIPCTVWNLGDLVSSGSVELQLGFESQQDLDSAKKILGIKPTETPAAVPALEPAMA